MSYTIMSCIYEPFYGFCGSLISDYLRYSRLLVAKYDILFAKKKNIAVLDEKTGYILTVFMSLGKIIL